MSIIAAGRMARVALATLTLSACQDPDPLTGAYRLESVTDQSQGTEALALPATVHPGFDIPGSPQSTLLVHSGELRVASNGRFTVEFTIDDPPSLDGGAGTWTRRSDGVHFADGEGYDRIAIVIDGRLRLGCYGPNLTCNYVRH